MLYVLNMKTISIKITDKQYKKLKELVKQTEISMSEQIRRAIEKCYLVKK